MRLWVVGLKSLTAVFLLMAIAGDLASLPGQAQSLPAASASGAEAATTPPDAASVAASAAAGCVPTCTTVVINQGTRTKSGEWPILASLASILQTFGLLAAGLFFSWKLVSGYQAVNMNVALELMRQPRDDAQDYLVIRLTLEKGDREASSVKRIGLTVQREAVQALGDGPLKMPMQEDVTPKWDDVNEENVEDAKQRLFVTPGETARFEKVIAVGRDDTLLVAAQVLADSGFAGRHRFARKWEAKWRTTAISTPADRSTPQETKSQVGP